MRFPLDSAHRLVVVLTAMVLMGCSSTKWLACRKGDEWNHRNYVSEIAHQSALISVDFVSPKYTTQCFSRVETNLVSVGCVMGKNLLGEHVGRGNFDAGKIIEGEFKKIVRSNFALPPRFAPSTAEFSFMIDHVALRMEAENVIASVGVSVKVSRVGHSDEVAYDKGFSAIKSERWKDLNFVPGSFYAALKEIIKQFLDDWASGRAVLTLKKWADEDQKHPPTMAGNNPVARKPPRMESFCFTNRSDICCGTSKFSCNDYDASETARWALDNVDLLCKRQIGIEPELVRIVYDEQEFKDGTWRYAFHAFARTKEPVMFFDGTRGRVTGDLELMDKKGEEAANALRQYVGCEMDRQIGPGPDGAKGKSDVRFDPVEIDKTNNLMTIPFRFKRQ